MRREKTSKAENFSILSKLKPRKIVIDKERLYEENMALKLKNNTLNEEMLRLRTRMTQIEKELNKKEDPTEFNNYLKPTHLLGNLKNSIKDLRQEIQQKNEEILKLKRNIKITKIGEIEVEVQAYIDECTRLRHHLEEIMRQKDTPQATQNFNPDEQNMQQSILMSNLKRENDNLNQAVLLGKDEISKWRERVQELEKEKKKNTVRKGEVNGLKAEIKQMKGQIEGMNKDFSAKESGYKEELSKQRKVINEFTNKSTGYENKIKELQAAVEEQKKNVKNLQDNKNAQSLVKKQFPPKLFRILYFLTSLRRVSIKNVVQGIDKKGKGLLSAEDFYEGLLELTKKIKKKHVNEVSGFLRSGKSLIDMNRVLEYFEEFVYEGKAEVSSSDEESILKKTGKVEEVNFDSPINHSKKRNISGKSNEKLSNADDSYSGKKSSDADKGKGEEVKGKEEKRGIEERQRAEEKKKIEEQRKIEEKQRAEEQRKLEERRKLEEKQRLEEKQKIEEKQKMEERQKSEEKKKQEDKKKSEQKKNEEDQLKLDTQKKTDKLTAPTNPDPRRPQSAKPISSQSKDLFLHLSFRMQLNRIPKSKLYITLFPSISQDRQVTSKDLLKAFKSAPFSFTDPESEALTKSLLDSGNLSAKLIEEKIIKNTENWEIFTPEDENEFDEQLGSIISKNKLNLKENCKIYDKEKSGLISLPDFEKVLKDSKIDFPARVFKYMLLLFYSHDMKIGQVPYRHFIKAYGEAAPEDDYEASDELSDEEKAKIVRHYLGIISKILVKNKRTAADVFEYDENGIISAEEFIMGLKRLNLTEIENDHIMIMLEALQLEDAEEVCVSIEELEEILAHYGVGKNADSQEFNKNPDSQDFNEPEEDNSQGHFKKVSLLDSDQYESGSEDFEYGDDFNN